MTWLQPGVDVQDTTEKILYSVWTATVSAAPYRSPKGGYEGADLRIGHAMKAGESGHPFEIQLLRIPPGKRPWPYHFHASQWEFYYVLEGSGEMRLESQTVPIGTGDAMMCPPREAHQLHNTGECDLPDAAVVLRPVKSKDIFSLQFRVKDLLLCPTAHDVWFNNRELP